MLLWRSLSWWGEHCVGWLSLAAVGAARDVPNRKRWVRAGSSVLGAHASSVVLKRLVRQRRPPAERRRIRVRTEWTFPSSHATSAAAAAVAFSDLVPRSVLWPLSVAVAWSRIRLRVHRPRDVAGGVLLGLAVAGLHHRAPADPSLRRHESEQLRELGG